MTTELNKEFEYRGYKFNIKIILFQFTSDEKKSGNKNNHHTVIVNDMGQTNYQKKYDAEDCSSTEYWTRFMHDITFKTKQWVDEREDISINSRHIYVLNQLGFK